MKTVVLKPMLPAAREPVRRTANQVTAAAGADETGRSKARPLQ